MDAPGALCRLHFEPPERPFGLAELHSRSDERPHRRVQDGERSRRDEDALEEVIGPEVRTAGEIAGKGREHTQQAEGEAELDRCRRTHPIHAEHRKTDRGRDDRPGVRMVRGAHVCTVDDDRHRGSHDERCRNTGAHDAGRPEAGHEQIAPREATSIDGQATRDEIGDRAGGDERMPKKEQPWGELRRRGNHRHDARQHRQHEHDTHQQDGVRAECSAEHEHEARSWRRRYHREQDEEGRDIADDGNRIRDRREHRKPRIGTGRKQHSDQDERDHARCGEQGSLTPRGLIQPQVAPLPMRAPGRASRRRRARDCFDSCCTR